MPSFLVAVAFLTILPLPSRWMPTPAEVARARWWYPAVGLLLAALLAAWAWLVSLLGPGLGAWLVLAAWLGVTGALHFDGLCDVCDGLFTGQTAEERLRIMKDPHLGAYGLAGGGLVLLGKWTALQGLLATTAGPVAVASAIAVARCLVLAVAAGRAYPRPEGIGKVLIEATASWEGPACRAAAFLLHGVIWLPFFGLAPLWFFLPAWVASHLLPWLFVRRLGGITGDCLGASIELTELLLLLLAAAFPSTFAA
ncbi:MAG: adenosylcobinamide-GDP ribazoletransferase [Gemmataceae bacterium]|nr:adenosylcobinamide-GDP ribazoletransferase [Gemmataceae bacterium]MDW8263920.1 adenosylcobinamide-GDP ribazoletransferase [Gemmataceae bacterium]